MKLISLLFVALAFACVFTEGADLDGVEDQLVSAVDNKPTKLGKQLVNAINKRAKTFKARRYPQFEGLSNKELASFMGAEKDLQVDEEFVGRSKRQAPTSAVVPPASFDVSNKWPQCKKTFETLLVQSKCGNCWAVSTTAVITDRRCIYYNKTSYRMSAWDLTQCCKECAVDGNNGCEGGNVFKAVKYYISTGIVTGEAYGGAGCKPYAVSPNATTRAVPGKCVTTCQASHNGYNYTTDRRRGLAYNLIQLNNTQIMQEIMNNGPVIAHHIVYKDFWQYSSGIYAHTTGEELTGHLVKIVGWGVENGVKYWRVATALGPKWGEKGYFRIKRGTNECGIENYIIGVTVGKASG